MAEAPPVEPRRPAPLAATRAIALNTFREAIRDRILYLLLAFALILIGVSRLVSLLTVGDEGKIVKDMGLGAISIFGVLTAGFVGVSLVFKEIEKRTVYTLLANPVRRWQFVVGKFLGLAAVLALNAALMTAALFALLLFRGQAPWDLLPAIALIYVELLIVTAFALLFSSLTNPILAAIWTIAVYVAGHLAWSLELLKERIPEGAGRVACDLGGWLLPRLDRLNVTREAVHGIPLADGQLVAAATYGLSYAFLALALACLAFQRKEFQ